jgi:hypothetical protein
MITTLMTEIRECVTRGVTALPLKRNLVPRFMKGGGAQETMNDALTANHEGQWGS